MPFVTWAITKKDVLGVCKFHFVRIKKHVFTCSKCTRKPSETCNVVDSEVVFQLVLFLSQTDDGS